MADTENRQTRDGPREEGTSVVSLVLKALPYIVLFFLVTNMSGKAPTRTMENTLSVHSKTPASPSSRSNLRPLARPGDIFQITLDTDPPLFESVKIERLFFNHAALEAANVSVTIPVNLERCVMENCTVALRVRWSLRNYTFSSSAPLVRFFRDSTGQKKYLFGNNIEGEDMNAKAADSFVYNQYFQPQVTLSPVVFFDYPLPEPYLEFTPVVESLPGFYGPSLYINNFWVLREHHMRLNASSASQSLNLTVHLSPLSLTKALLYTQLESMATQATFGRPAASDTEEMKRMMLDVSTKSPILLVVTAFVTLLHSLFEFLAFSNDVKFWKNGKNFRGLSLRSVVINCYFQSIIFLYLLDSHDTSWAVLVPAGMGVLMEFWKLAKTLQIVKVEASAQTALEKRVVAGRKGTWRIAGYEIGFNGSYDSRTQKYDNVAVRYLLYAMIPLLTGYAVYSAFYKTHRNWYSFLISTQVQFIYTFEFVQMTPQIFINYKMKSVGQLPLRTFIYKALNTVIDDLFAFVIKMPWLHRLACFQDDVVFAILLYQRWIYPVDKSRFDGESGADMAEESASPRGAVEADRKNK